jgi:diguanylate cyclase (GGDEF)-like protein
LIPDAESNPEAFPEIELRGGTVLLIDDDATIRAAAREHLAEGGLFTTFFEATNGLEGFKVLANHAAELDLVLCDLEMPEFDGLKFLQMRATRADFASVPVIFLTSRSEVGHRVKGLEMGANDYLAKPVAREELRLRARNQLQIRRLEIALRRAVAELARLSRTDALTGLPNRRHFVESLEREFQRSSRYGSSLGLLVFDIDHFKRVNDTWGHLAGDKVLRDVAGILAYGLRQSDIAARFGGEEFAVLLPETDLEGATLVAERYRLDIAARQFQVDSTSLQLTVSIGIAALPRTKADDATEFLRRADAALYQAKEAGRNRVVGAADEP